MPYSLEELCGLPSVWSDRELPYLPKPNTVDVILTQRVAPLDITPTAFVVPMLSDGRAVFSRNRRRGIEIPGGHIEKGEDALAAAIREAMEETGCEVSDLQPIGFLRMSTKGVKPCGYLYPYPIGFQQFFVGTVVRKLRYHANSECLEPVILQPTQVRSPDGPLRESHRLFHAEAYKRLFVDCEMYAAPK